jgi:hypothetical protein
LVQVALFQNRSIGKSESLFATSSPVPEPLNLQHASNMFPAEICGKSKSFNLSLEKPRQNAKGILSVS